MFLRIVGILPSNLHGVTIQKNIIMLKGYLDLTGTKHWGNLEFFITVTFVIYTGHMTLLR